MHELKLAIEKVLALANAKGQEDDDNLFCILEHNDTMAEFEDALYALDTLYEEIKDKL